jgi:integrase
VVSPVKKKLTDVLLKSLKVKSEAALKAKKALKAGGEAPKAPEVGRIEVGDTDCRGLSVRVAPTAVMTWTYAYKHAGRMRRITLGEYPAIGLGEARETADEMRKQRRAGTDPSAQRDRERVAQASADIAFDALCDLYIKHTQARGKQSWKADEGLLKRPKAAFGKRAASAVTKPELIELLVGVARTSKTSANRMQTVLHTMLKWAAERGSVPVNLLAGVGRVGGKEAEKERVLTLAELKAFLPLLDALSAPDNVGRALRVILLTAQRPGEVAGMMRSELHDLDGPAPHWIIPTAKTKNKLAEHTVPLSPAALRLIVEALNAPQGEPDGTNDQPVFADNLKGVSTLARYSLNEAVRRAVADNKLLAFTPHDLRRTAATLAQSVRTPVDHVKALLNHHDKGVTGVYARWHYFEEKRAAVLGIESVVSPLIMPLSDVRPQEPKTP